MLTETEREREREGEAMENRSTGTVKERGNEGTDSRRLSTWVGDPERARTSRERGYASASSELFGCMVTRE